jgi:hypothetical protein
MRTQVHRTLNVFLMAVIVILAASCKDDEISMPEILEFRLGYDNVSTFHPGDDLHIDAEIVAANGIDVIIIEIHSGHNHHKKVLRFANGDHDNDHDDHHEWEEEIRFEKFRGLKNTDFHEHIDIPHDAAPGDYDLHFIVVDQEGYTAKADAEFTIAEKEDH